MFTIIDLDGRADLRWFYFTFFKTSNRLNKSINIWPWVIENLVPALPCGSTRKTPGFYPGARPCAMVGDIKITGRPGRPSGPMKNPN